MFITSDFDIPWGKKLKCAFQPSLSLGALTAHILLKSRRDDVPKRDFYMLDFLMNGIIQGSSTKLAPALLVMCILYQNWIVRNDHS